ncbi:MAG: hypothetical protein KC547_20440, partial [Anaerolineae bacterium]|nr:hypothetical protein [Anaerolineae bacterium]
ALIRNLVRLFDFLPLLYGVGLVALFVTQNTQRLGDLAAKTVVIRERRNLTVSTLKENLAIHYFYLKATDPVPPYIDLDRLTFDDRRTVVDYLQRRPELRNSGSIARMLARNMARKIGFEPAQNGSLSAAQCDLFLEQIARAFELAERTAD